MTTIKMTLIKTHVNDDPIIPYVAARCEFCGAIVNPYCGLYDEEAIRKLPRMSCPRCGRITELDAAGSPFKTALKSMTELRWSLTGKEADKAETILKNLIELESEIRKTEGENERA